MSLDVSAQARPRLSGTSRPGWRCWSHTDTVHKRAAENRQPAGASGQDRTGDVQDRTSPDEDFHSVAGGKEGLFYPYRFRSWSQTAEVRIPALLPGLGRI